MNDSNTSQSLQYKPQGLYLHEWLSVLALILFLVTAIGFSLLEKNKIQKLPQASREVKVVGAIKEEKIVSYEEEETMRDLLSQLEFTENVDKAKLQLDSLLKGKQIVVIPTIGYLSVYLTGAIENEGLLLLPEGSTFKDLKGHLILKENAEPNFFKRKRRRLLEGEIIRIPCKNS